MTSIEPVKTDKFLIVTYPILAAWIVLLSLTDALSWLGSYHVIWGQSYPPIPDLLLLILLLTPITCLAIPMAHKHLQLQGLTETTRLKYLNWMFFTIIIVVISYFIYFLLSWLIS
ncbi:hypothetical protein D3C87_1661580 [compost metagenome]